MCYFVLANLAQLRDNLLGSMRLDDLLTLTMDQFIGSSSVKGAERKCVANLIGTARTMLTDTTEWSAP